MSEAASSSDAPAAAAAAEQITPTPAPSAQADITVDDVARFLLAKDYTLTALELYQETTEAGVAPVAALRDHFLGPGLTPAVLTPSERGILLQRSSTSSLRGGNAGAGTAATSSHHGGGRGDSSSSGAPDATVAKQLKERDDRVGLLEYELRIAKEDLDAARAQLKALKDAQPASPQQPQQTDVAVSGGTMTEQEGKALHYIVKRHLMANRLNMTAITLAEELKAADIDGWEEAGIEGLAEAPELLLIYRQFVHKAVYVPSGFKERIEALQRECAVLQRVAKEGEHTIVALSADKAALEKKISEARVTIEKLQQARPRSSSNTTSTAAPSVAPATTTQVSVAVVPEAKPPTTTTAAKPTPSPPTIDVTSPPPPAATMQPQTAKTWQDEFRRSRRDKNAVRLRERPVFESRLAQMVRRLSELEEADNGVVQVLSESLPFLVRGVILAKREELVPLFLCAVQRSTDHDSRLALTSLFFNLIKRPDEQQRALITEGFTALAALVGPTRTTEELLEQCTKEVGSKYEERRILVADACTGLAQYTNPGSRITAILATLTNLLQDKSNIVRVAAVKNLASLITYFADDSKLQSLLSETARLLRDTDDLVVSAVIHTLVLALIDWSDAMGKLHSGFVAFFFEQTANFLKQLRQSEGTMDEADRAVLDEHTRHAQLLLSCIDAAVPSIADSLLLSVPNTAAPPSVRVGGVMGPEDRASLRAALESLLSAIPTAMPADLATLKSGSSVVDWFAAGFLQSTIQAALLSPSPSCLVLERVSFVVSSLLRETNSPGLNSRIAQPVLLSRIAACTEEKDRAKLLAHYVLGVLAVLPSEEVFAFVKATSQGIALSQEGWTPYCSRALRTSLALLCGTKGGARHEPVLAALQELAGNQSPKVRAFAASLLAAVSNSLQPAAIAAKVLPPLTALKSDPDPDVRCEDCSALAVLLASTVADQSTVDKAALAMEPLSDDKLSKVRVAVCRAFGEVAQYIRPILVETCVQTITKTSLIADSHCQHIAVIAPKLAQLSENLRGLETEQDKADVAAAIWQAFRQYQGTGLNGSTVSSQVIPALRNVLASTQSLDPGVRQAVEGKLRQLEVAVGALKPGSAPMSTSTPPTSPSKPAVTGAPQPAPTATDGAKQTMDKLRDVFRIGGKKTT